MLLGIIGKIQHVYGSTFGVSHIEILMPDGKVMQLTLQDQVHSDSIRDAYNRKEYVYFVVDLFYDTFSDAMICLIIETHMAHEKIFVSSLDNDDEELMIEFRKWKRVTEEIGKLQSDDDVVHVEF